MICMANMIDRLQLINSQQQMLNSPKNNLVGTGYPQRQAVFSIDRYKFTGVPSSANQYIKTSTNRKITSQDVSNVTRLHHPNLIALKKIGKSKKSGQEGLFWLYYESVPYNLELVFLRTNFDINSQIVETTLVSVKNYLASFNICPSFYQFNIGVNQFGIIKIYVSIQSILKNNYSIEKQLVICENRIKEIRKWYGNIYSRRSYKPNQLPKSISDKQLLNTNISKIQEIKEDLQKLRKQMKSEQSKNGSVIETPITNKNNLRNTNFNLKHEVSAVKLNTNNNRIVSRALQVDQPNNNHNLIINILQRNQVKHSQQYDNQSVDTYQMEMGEDFQMPSIRTNQKLRQTVINNKKCWDTLTCKTPASNKQNICESAVKSDFMKIIQNNKRVLKESALKRKDSSSDNKTVQENLKQKNWQTSTIKSTLPPNIQDRVQQALAKTKNVMEMLKITKSFSAGK